MGSIGSAVAGRAMEMEPAKRPDSEPYHTRQTCLLPIGGRGVHTIEEGSRAAAREYAALLEEDPDDLVCRWLLNIAHMTLGEYPDKVPRRWLIPPEVFRSEYDIGRFPDVAGLLGLDAEGHSGGSIMEALLTMLLSEKIGAGSLDAPPKAPSPEAERIRKEIRQSVPTETRA